MTRYAVQCMATTYVMATVIVEADSLEDACKKGINASENESDWENVDSYGQTFVDGIVKDPSDDPLADICDSKTNIPVRYSEDGIGRDWS